ncbi:MAG: hypothetical protein ACLQAT_07085 [Candidatus Binataceae bacterium]
MPLSRVVGFADGANRERVPLDLFQKIERRVRVSRLATNVRAASADPNPARCLSFPRGYAVRFAPAALSLGVALRSSRDEWESRISQNVTRCPSVSSGAK